jgi:demethylmenaquinone methyltransferase/2-methoxy-6-polyprenyl-1,4-benzoquinol methylase
VRAGYLAYFKYILPRIGRVISHHNSAYGYLPASVGAFASPAEFVTILRQRGFVEVRAVPLTFGIVYLYTARRGEKLEGGKAEKFPRPQADGPGPPAGILL